MATAKKRHQDDLSGEMDPDTSDHEDLNDNSSHGSEKRLNKKDHPFLSHSMGLPST